MATAFDVPSEASLSLNGRATTYRPSFVRDYGNAPHMFFLIPTNERWRVLHRVPRNVLDLLANQWY
jgi:hypothetical protein